MHKTLQGMQQEAEMERSQLDPLGNDLIVQEMAEEITQRLGTSTRTDRSVPARELVDLVEKSGPLLSTLGLPQAVGIWHGSTKFDDREKRRRVTEK